MSSGTLTVITGPSGVGKGTLVKKILERNDKLWLSISSTTRKPRQTEIEGKDYFFLEKERFKSLIKEGGFLEWAEFAGNFYGTPKSLVKEKLKQGINVLLEIELQGARQIRKSFPDAFHVFIAPPSFDELERRIRGRGTDEENAIIRRLNRAQEEMNAKDEFDAVLVNDDLESCLKLIEGIIF